MIGYDEAKKRHRKLKSRWSDESKLTQEVLISILGFFEKGMTLRRKKREPSEYNLHMAKELKAGKTFKEAIKSYKKK